jgi:hypothetical protein
MTKGEISMKSAIAVCVGAPLLALGIGAAPSAWAAPGDHGATVNINGDLKHTSAGSTADSTPSTGTKPNIAVAVNGSRAAATDGAGLRAIAVNSSDAAAVLGTNNTATAINNSIAVTSTPGSNNTARAINYGSARVQEDPIFPRPVDNSTAIALNGAPGNLSRAFALRSDATAIATCGGGAVARSGTVIGTGDACG